MDRTLINSLRKKAHRKAVIGWEEKPKTKSLSSPDSSIIIQILILIMRSLVLSRYLFLLNRGHSSVT